MRNFNHETFKEMIFQVKVILDIKKSKHFLPSTWQVNFQIDINIE